MKVKIRLACSTKRLLTAKIDLKIDKWYEPTFSGEIDHVPVVLLLLGDVLELRGPVLPTLGHLVVVGHPDVLVLQDVVFLDDFR